VCRSRFKSSKFKVGMRSLNVEPREALDVAMEGFHIALFYRTDCGIRVENVRDYIDPVSSSWLLKSHRDRTEADWSGRAL
jgi:hypothetical protein